MATKPKKKRSEANGKVPAMPPMPLRDDMILTYEEAAAYLRATPRQIERWVIGGKLPAKTLPAGRGRRIEGVDIRRALEAGPTARTVPASRPKVRTTHAKRTAR